MVRALKCVSSDFDPDEAIELFNAAVRRVMKNGVKDRQDAIAKVVKRNPALHKAFLLATNPKARSQRLINEKYEEK
jgi:hypothetical protein